MKARMTNDMEDKTVHAKRSPFTTKGLLNSDYKRTVKSNFKRASKKSLFGIKQRIKSPRMCKTSHATSMVLKVSVFVSVALVACV